MYGNAYSVRARRRCKLMNGAQKLEFSSKNPTDRCKTVKLLAHRLLEIYQK
jgi:hypothetical protein